MIAILLQTFNNSMNSLTAQKKRSENLQSGLANEMASVFGDGAGLQKLEEVAL